MEAGGTRPIECPTSAVDLWAPEVLVDPYPTYRALRDLGPVVWLERHGVLALPHFAVVRSVLTNWQRFSSAAGVGVDDGANSMMPESIIKSDPPAHDEHRRLLANQLTIGSLADASGEVERTAESLVAELVARGAFDAVADLARPYSVTVVGDLIGLPDEGRDELAHLAERAFNIFGPFNERLADAPAALEQLFGHAFGVAGSGQLSPGRRAESLVEQGRPDAIVAYTWPGIDTTVNAIASAVYLFARHPDQWDLVRGDPSLIPSAFAEVLRMHAPVHYFTRRTTEPVELDGLVLPADARVLVMYGSANRDERHYPDPDRFDVTRHPSDQLAFGRGIHLCVGMNLAKLEAHTVLAALARHVERFELVGEPEWLLNNTLHGLARLPVSVLPAAAPAAQLASAPTTCPFDHHDPSLTGDVLDEVYGRLRAAGPLTWSDAYGGFWMVNRYDDVRTVESDTATYSSAAGVFVPRVEGQPLSVALEQDPPEHTAFRRLYNDLLGRPKVADAEPLIRALAAEYVGAFIERGGGEFMTEVAAKLPVEVISSMLGLPADISSQLRELSEDAWKERFGDPGAAPRTMGQLMMGEAMQRLAEPRDDFLTALVGTRIDGRPIDPFEVVSFLLGAAIAGHETTMNGAGNLCYELADDPGLQARVRADRALVPALVEESLRLRAPVQNFFRTVTRDHQLHGQTLRSGDRVMVVYGAANHDPEAFEDPDRLSLERGANRHLSFGWGAHRCPGAHLAQVELRHLVDRLLDGPPFELAGDVVFGPMESGGTFLGIRSLPIRFRR